MIFYKIKFKKQILSTMCSAAMLAAFEAPQAMEKDADLTYHLSQNHHISPIESLPNDIKNTLARQLSSQNYKALVCSSKNLNDHQQVLFNQLIIYLNPNSSMPHQDMQDLIDKTVGMNKSLVPLLKNPLKIYSNELLDKFGFVMLPQSPSLLKYLYQDPNLAPISVSLKDYPELARAVYKLAFGVDLPIDPDQNAIAINHLESIFPTVFGDKNNTNLAIDAFINHYGHQPKKLIKPSDKPYLSIIDTDTNYTHVTTPHNVVVTYDQLRDRGVKPRLKQLIEANPEHHIIVNVNGLTDGVLYLGRDDLPQGIKHLTLTGDVTKIEERFLKYCESLKIINLSGLRNLITIGDYFASCQNLESIDLSPLINLTTIGCGFLAHCKSLKFVDLSGLAKITTIEEEFLANCESLTSVDLSPLTSVTKIRDEFLFGCTSLTLVNLSGLNNVTSIGGEFLGACKSLTSVDLSPLSNVTKIGDGFLCYCSSLMSVDLTALSNITKIGEGFLGVCISLTSVDLSPFKNVTTIKDLFLYNCTSLTSIDLSPLSNVIKVREGFLINVSPASNETSSDYCFDLNYSYLLPESRQEVNQFLEEVKKRQQALEQ